MRRSIVTTRIIVGALILAFVYWIARNRIAFPVPPHSREEWGIFFAYVTMAFIVGAHIAQEMRYRRPRTG